MKSTMSKRRQPSSRYALFITEPINVRTISEPIEKCEVYDVHTLAHLLDSMSLTSFLSSSEVRFFDNFAHLNLYQNDKKKKRIVVDDKEFGTLKPSTFRLIPPEELDTPSFDLYNGLDCYILYRLYDSNHPLLKGDALRMSRINKRMSDLGLVSNISKDGVPVRHFNTDRKLIIDSSVKRILNPTFLESLTPESFIGTTFDTTCQRPSLMLNNEVFKVNKVSTGYVDSCGHAYILPIFLRTAYLDSVDSLINTFYISEGRKFPLFRLVGCGHCMPCLESVKARLSSDISHEVLYQLNRFSHPFPVFVTLTYSDENVGSNNIDSTHFTKYCQQLHQYFAPTRRDKLEDLDVILRKHYADAYLAKHGDTPANRDIAYRRFDCRSVHVSKNTGLMAHCFKNNNTNLADNSLWTPDQFLNYDFNIIGASEYGGEKGRRHFHALMFGFPEQLFHSPNMNCISPFVDCLDGVKKNSIIPSDELIALLQYFWPYGNVEVSACYGDASKISSYITKYVCKQSADKNHSVSPRLYMPRRPLGKYFVDMFAQNYLIREGLKNFSLFNRRQNDFVIRGKLFHPNNPTNHLVEANERCLSSLMPSCHRRYIATAYKFAINRNQQDIVDLIDSFLAHRSVSIRKLFIEDMTEYDFEDITAPDVRLEGCYNDGYVVNPTYLNYITDNPFHSSLRCTKEPFTYNSVNDILEVLHDSLSQSLPYCPYMSAEEYYDMLVLRRESVNREVPKSSRVRLDNLFDRLRRSAADRKARCVCDHQ